jgi:hypothetical protein
MHHPASSSIGVIRWPAHVASRATPLGLLENSWLAKVVLPEHHYAALQTTQKKLLAMKIRKLAYGAWVLLPSFLAVVSSCGYDFSVPAVDSASNADSAAGGRGEDANKTIDAGSNAGADGSAEADIAVPLDTIGDAFVATDTLLPLDASQDLPDTPDVPLSMDTTSMDTTADSVLGKDGPLFLDANTPDADSAVQVTPDAPADLPLDTPPDLPPKCGGCCTNADCPATAPVCGVGNQCTKCGADENCAGYPGKVCNSTSGACVECAKRSDCPNACQTCTNGVCMAVKGADDLTKCAGTCDDNGVCKSKEGQSCGAVLAGCISGTTCSSDNICRSNPCTSLANGASCGSGKVCNEGTCQIGCWIAGAFVTSGGGTAANICQICAPNKATNAWSNDDSKNAVTCGSCGGTAACSAGKLGPCSVDAKMYYPDGDHDGYGAATGGILACSKPTDYVDDNSDCCDRDANAHPGQTQTFASLDGCDSFDYNCDGAQTPKSNGPTSCPASNCVLNASKDGCVQMGCNGCDSSCDHWTTADCGVGISITSTFCIYLSDGDGSCIESPAGHAAGSQECN